MAERNEDHLLDTRLLNKHKKTGGTEGGACLTRHISGVSTSSCSHRWQARERAANEDGSYYNGVRPDWNVVGGNFKKSEQPYLHQSHHIVPNAILNDGIAEASKSDISVHNLIRASLLMAEYNLNHKSNMIILPMKPRESNVLRLPRHLRPHERAHPAYSAMVRLRVQPILNDYAKLINDSRGKDGHPAAPGKLSKAKLLRVSAQMRAVIFTWGRVAPGAALEGKRKP